MREQTVLDDAAEAHVAPLRGAVLAGRSGALAVLVGERGRASVSSASKRPLPSTRANRAGDDLTA